MKLRTRIKNFMTNESGVISAEMMVLAAAGGLLCVAVMVFANSGVEQMQKDRAYQLKAQEKVTTF